MRSAGDAMNILHEIKTTAKGAEILADWLGSGMEPVPSPLAHARAETCVGCPFNVQPKWWERTKNAIADAIKSQLEVREKTPCRTRHDDKLAMCSRCGCCLQLKVWVPIDVIKSHTDISNLVGYPAFCWQRIEMTT